MPTAPRSSTKVHSAAIRLTTSSGLNIGATLHYLELQTVLNRYKPRSCRFCSVIAEIDIWRAAQLMLRRYGEKAEEESAARADELASAGDDDGATTWRRIMAAVTQLANKIPPGLVH